MSTDQNKVIARRIVDESWTKHNPSILDGIFSNDAVLHDPQNPTVAKGPQGAKSTLARYLRAFPDLKITIEREIADGDYVVQHLRASGTNTGEFNGNAGDWQEHQRYRRHDEQDQGWQGHRGLVTLRLPRPPAAAGRPPRRLKSRQSANPSSSALARSR